MQTGPVAGPAFGLCTAKKCPENGSAARRHLTKFNAIQLLILCYSCYIQSAGKAASSQQENNAGRVLESQSWLRRMSGTMEDCSLYDIGIMALPSLHRLCTSFRKF